MAGDKILVLGGTGPAGLCLLRELMHRSIRTVVYARSPSKIPDDLASNSLITIVKGNMDQSDTLSTAVAQSRTIISLLDPSSIKQPKNTEFADFYRTVVLLMRNHGVQRIFALGTTAMYHSEDRVSISRFFMASLIKILASGAHHNVMAIQSFFERDPLTSDIQWTIFRLGNLSGTADESAWRRDREREGVYVGPVGGTGFTSGVNRSTLAKWLAESAESGAPNLIGSMPAISRLAGSK